MKVLDIFAEAHIDVPGKGGTFNIMGIIDWATTIMGLVAVVFIVVAGVIYVTSQGDPNKTKKAMHALLYAVIGLVIVVLAKVIVFFISSNVG